MTSDLTAIQRLKLDIFERGIVVDDAAREALTSGGRLGLTHADYPTTGGLALVIPEDAQLRRIRCRRRREALSASTHGDARGGGRWTT
jgi:hypothetical protein